MERKPGDAEGGGQEAFGKAMSRLDQFAGTPGENRDDLHAWVSRIAANASIDVIRKRRDGRLFSLEEPIGTGEETLGTNVTAWGAHPHEGLSRRANRRLMAEGRPPLPPQLVQTVRLVADLPC